MKQILKHVSRANSRRRQGRRKEATSPVIEARRNFTTLLMQPLLLQRPFTK